MILDTPITNEELEWQEMTEEERQEQYEQEEWDYFVRNHQPEI